jgi:Tol biopolymer transport system component/tRNA A-37 threonylcarbamoyl transferase component Bud32
MSNALDRLTAALADRYRLERELGQGGMATVYLAHDLRHDRQVAVKVLRPELAASLGSERFLREIRIAAQLSHPHILPLHDSGEAGGFLFYVMPYVDGESLRGRLDRMGELSVPEAVSILREVADGLAYAHERRVVHRDIKPDNVLLSGRHALVTDFGVAKAVSEATGRHSLTTAGVALGTPSYMAPEQAAADPHTDHRVDIYALGVMAYEMLTGRPPFVAPTAQEVLAAQVTKTPESVGALRPSCPPILAQMIMRCLEKKPADRPQSAEELRLVLELVATPSGGTTPAGTRPIAAVQKHRWPIGRVSTLLAVGVLAAAAVVVLQKDDQPPVALGRQSRITDAAGLETDPVISPDGRLIAYSAGTYFQSHIFVRQLSGGPAIDLTAALPGHHTRPRWAPGGDELLFVTNDGAIRRVNRVSTLGGLARTLVELQGNEAIASADWSPDGTRIAYDVGNVVYVSAASGAPSVVYEGTDPHSVTWSPDGRHIALVESRNLRWHGATGYANTAPSSILVIPAAGGTPATVAPFESSTNLSPTWGSDSRSLFFISDRDGAKDVYLARLNSRGGLSAPSQRLSTGLNAHTLALSPDGRTLSYSTLAREANVWMLPLRPGEVITDDAAVQVTAGNQMIERVMLSSDGRWLLFDSDRRGNSDIYRLRLDQPGAEPEQLTTDSANDYAAAFSPDGRSIVFHSLRSGNRDLWLMSSDGTNQRQLTTSQFQEYAGAWSPDGRSIAFYKDSASTYWLNVISLGANGEWGPSRSRLPQGDQPSWSPDGNEIATVHDGAVALVTINTGEVQRLYELPSGFPSTQNLFWSADGRSIYYRVREADGRLSLLQLPVNGGARVPLVQQRDASRAGPRFDWTTDGRRFFFTIQHYEGDIWTVEVR